MKVANWSARDKAVGLLCLAVVALVIIALIQGKFSVVAMLPAVAVIALLYRVIWQNLACAWEGIFDWILRRRR
jgi:hypothetical protein